MNLLKWLKRKPKKSDDHDRKPSDGDDHDRSKISIISVIMR